MATRIKGPFPDLDWPDQAIITVDAGDSSAVITGLVIHLSQDVPQEAIKLDTVPPVLISQPSGTEAPGHTPGG